MRLEHALAMPTHLARRNRAGRTMTPRPLHNRRNGYTKPSRNSPAGFPSQNCRHYALTKIIRQRSAHPMLAPISSQHLESQIQLNRNPSDSANLGNALAHELTRQGLKVRNQVPIPIRYEDLTIDHGYRVDLLVNDLVVVELKSIEAVLPVHRGQLLSYLRLGGFRLGYLLNFNVAHMRDGIIRMVNGL